MYRYLDVLLVDQDPAVIVAAHLNKNGGIYEKELLNIMKKISICHTSKNKFPVPNIPELFQFPFEPKELAKNELILEILKDSCILWTQTIQDTLSSLPKIEALDLAGPLEFPKLQIQYWRNREKELEILIEDFTFPAYERSLGILKEGNIQGVPALTSEMEKTYDLLREAKDHVRFLGTIEDSLNMICSTEDFNKLIDIIPSIAVSLRNIWLLSKCFNTDQKIHHLILMISSLINQRIIETIRLKEFESPDELKIKVEMCITLLENWKQNFLKVRKQIEESRKEKRWEFELNDLFSDTDHITTICKDILIICKILIELKNSFLEEMKEITLRPQYIQKAIEKIKIITEGLYNIKFKPFDKKTSHHWSTLMSWFQREVLFLEAESGKVIEETFDYLIKSDMAAKKLKYLKELPLREKIKLKYMRKVNGIISKFSSEIDEAQTTFDKYSLNPPIADNLPPISGSIFWSQEISLSLKSTLKELESLQEVVDFSAWKEVKGKLDTVLTNLEKYKINKYTDWSNKVSDILEINLGRNLIKLDKNEGGSSTFVVNFTSVLSDTFAEVLNMEKIGFKVPEVAKNMSMQESKLIDISDQLEQMLKHYHQVLCSIEGADKQLLLENLKETEKALRPGLIRLTWNSLGISDYISQSEIAICRAESVIRQVLSIKENIEEKIHLINSAKLFEKFLNHGSHELKNFEEFHSDILQSESHHIDKLVGHYQDICPLLMKVEELLVSSRTKSHTRMKNYFSHWEGIIYMALNNMVKKNLDDLLLLLESKTPLFNVKVMLINANVAISPSEQMILKGMIMILKTLLDGTKMFIRWGNGTCIPMEKARVKGEIRPTQPSFFEDIVRIPEIIEKVNLVQNSIVESLEHVKVYLGSWKKYKNLWKYDKKSTCNKFLERLPSCVDFDAKLLYYSLLERQIEDREFTSNFKCIELSLSPLKTTLLNETQEWINCLGKLLEKTAKEELTKLQVTLDKLNKCLIYPKNGDELENSLQAISSIWKMSLSVEISYREIEEKYRTLNMYGIKIEKSQITAARNLPKLWETIFHKSKEVHFRVSPMKEKYTEITKMLIKKFLKEMDDLYTVFQQSGPSSVGSNLDKGLELLHTFKNEFIATCDKAKELNLQEKLYVLPITNFEVLKALKKDIETLEQIYNLYKRYSKYEVKWKKLTWKILDLDISEKDCKKIEIDLNSLCKLFTNQAPLSEIQWKVSHSKQLFKILRKLKESKLRNRHWKEIEKVTEVNIDEDINFKIETFWSFNLRELESKFINIIDKASHERSIESELQEIKEIWESLKFFITRESWHANTESHYILGDVNKIFENLLDHQALLDQMMKSPYSEHFIKDIDFWKCNLTLIEKAVVEWTEVQEIWMKISKALSIKGFRDNVQDVATFDDISKRYVRIMVETAKKPTVKDICLSSGFLSTIEIIKKELGEFQTLLNDAFELKRKQFPRFFFLSDDELISVLGGNIKEPNVQDLIMSLFQQLSAFSPDKEGNLEVLFTRDQEDLPLIKSVNTKNHAIEIWLTNLVDEIKISMKLMARLALRECKLKKESFFEDLKEFPNVLAIAIFEKLWNDEFIEAFQMHENSGDDFTILEEWKRLYGFCNNLLQKLMEMKDLSGVEKTRNCLFIKMLIAKKDLVDNFLNTCLSSKKDFNWEKIMKYYWNDEIFALEVRQGINEIDYGYEFMGASEISIHNPESEKVWFLINETIKNHNIPYLSGPTGTGKTAMMEDLGKRLGRGWRSVSLSQKFTIDSVVRYMRGVCESKFWGIIENINILDLPVMSVISSHFQTIKTAQTLHLREFSLNGKLTTMSPKVAFICTESKIEGAKGLKAIPLSLKIVFRKVSIQLPDMEKLVSTVMRVHGIKYPVTMSKQLVSSDKTISKVLNLPKLSKLRIYNMLTKKAVQMTIEFSEIPENQIFYNVMKDFYKSHLSIDKFDIANSILKDRFKIEKEIVINETGKDELSEPNINTKLTATQTGNIQTMLEMLKWTKSLIVCGPPFSGKSVIIKEAIKLLPDAPAYYYVNPSSYEQSTLLGSETNLGVFSRFFYKSKGSFVLHIDGICDEKMSFPIAQILDKEEFFCGSGRKFYSEGQKQIVIETTNISEISDAIKSRSLIINVCGDISDLPLAIISDRLKETNIEINEQASIVTQSLLIYETLCVFEKSSIDLFAGRNSLKKLSEALDIFQSLVKKIQESTLIEILAFSFLFAFTCCEEKQQRGDVINTLKSCLTANKELFADTFLKETLPEITNENLSTMKFSNIVFGLTNILLQNQMPIMIIGNRYGQEVFETIIKQFENKNTYNCSITFHALSDEANLTSSLRSKYLKRGKDILVPKGYRDVLISASDLHSPISNSGCRPLSLLKDIIEKKVFVYEEDICSITDINVISKISPKTKVFNQKKIFNKFICIFIEDNFEETVDLFENKMLQKHGKPIEEDIKKVASVARELFKSSLTSYSFLKMVHTSDMIVQVLVSLQDINNEDDIMPNFLQIVKAYLVSPIIDHAQKQSVLEWIKSCIGKFGIHFEPSSPLEISLDLLPDGLSLTEQQLGQCKEVKNFLINKGKVLSLYGEYGYGKTMVLEIAAKNTNFEPSYARNTNDLELYMNSKDNNLIIIRDNDINEDKMNDWLSILSAGYAKKVVFLMSKESRFLASWQQWILSNTQVLGIPYWNRNSLMHSIKGLDLETSFKEVLVDIHQTIIDFSEGESRTKPKIHITSKDLNEFVKNIGIKYLEDVTRNEGETKQLISVLDWIKKRKDYVDENMKQLHTNEKKLESLKIEMKQLKKKLKSLEDDKSKLSNDLEEESLSNKEMKNKENNLCEKFESIKSSSFLLFEKAVKDIENIRVDEIASFSKPMLVHEDIEKVVNILMLLLHADISGWKPFKEKFLNQDWQTLLEEFEPDSCKHKQEFVINKRFYDIKTKRGDLEKTSPIVGVIWNYIEGALIAFKTKFERDKYKKEMDEVQIAIIESERKINLLNKNVASLDKEIKKNEQKFQEMRDSCISLELSTTSTKKILEIENRFIDQSRALSEDIQNELQNTKRNNKDLLSDIVMRNVVGIYLGRFKSTERMHLLNDAKNILSKFKEPISDLPVLLEKLDISKMGTNFCDKLRLLTNKRVFFCYDPNDISKILLRKAKYIPMKVTELKDVNKIYSCIKSSNIDVIIVEDSYFENTAIMNKIFDEDLTKLNLKSDKYDTFLIFLTKNPNCSLPHKAYSNMFYLNFEASEAEVIVFMNSEFNRHSLQEVENTLYELYEKKDRATERIIDCKNKFFKTTSNRIQTMTEEIISNLIDLKKCKENLCKLDTEILGISGDVKKRVSDLSKNATPVIYGMFMLSKCKMAPEPSLFSFLESAVFITESKECTNPMLEIFRKYAYQISEKGRVLLASNMSIALLKINEIIDDFDINKFHSILQELEMARKHPEKRYIESMLLKYDLKKYTNKIEENNWTMKKLDESLESSGKMEYIKLITSFIIEQNSINNALVNFVQQTISDLFLKSSTIFVSDIHRYSSPYNPIVFLLESSVEEPSSDLTKLADLQGIASSKVKYLALSNENVSLAMSLLETAFIRGQWIIFQNVNLVPSFLPTLEKQINEKDKDDIHGDFRVWMTWCSEDFPPFTLLQKSIVLYCESCRDIRFHSNNFHYNVSTKAVENLNFSQNALFLTLCYLQKVFICRQKFKALSWNTDPDFPNYLVQTAHSFFKEYFQTSQDSPKKVEYSQLQYWTQEKFQFNLY